MCFVDPVHLGLPKILSLSGERLDIPYTNPSAALYILWFVSNTYGFV